MSKCDCPPAMGGQFLLSGAGLPKNMYKSRKSVLLELLNIEICAILYNVYPKRKGNLTLLHYDAILFDVDGTLIDSAPGILNTLEEVFSSMGVDVARSDLGRYIGPPLRKSFGEHFSDPAKIEEATKRYRVSYAAKGCHEGGVYPGVVEMLGRLKAAGLTLCTATCKPTDVVRPILEEQGLAPYFSFVGGASAARASHFVVPPPGTAASGGGSGGDALFSLRLRGRGGVQPPRAAGVHPSRTGFG